MQYVINQVPFEMLDISGHLFNSPFLSDVTFVIAEKQIYAHSLELMKRSTVFIKQLESTLAEKKLIPITNYDYDVYYQFLRYLYTDKCDINEDNCVVLLNLAKEYKLGGLVNAVQKFNNIEIVFNHVPHEMKHISCMLYDATFLSDVSFIVEGKVIYAHSLELMKRSSVFQQQFEETMGEQKQIPINDYGYETFCQFIRFIYTDKCDIDNQNCFELFKLAVKYKVISLVNLLQNSFEYNYIEILDFCVMEKDSVALFGVKYRLALKSKQLLQSNEFVIARQESIAEILKFDKVDRETSELHIVDALVRWMQQYSTLNKIKYSVCLQKFDKLIRLIPFVTLSNEELRVIRTKYPALLTRSDLVSIGGQKLFGDDYDSGGWNCTPRMKILDCEFVLQYSVPNIQTDFSVGSEMILGGFIIGKPFKDYQNIAFNYVNIKISCKNIDLDEINQTPLNININKYDPTFSTTFYGYVINLGSSIRVRPGVTYKILFKYSCNFISDRFTLSGLKCRNSKSEIIINAPPNSVQIKESHRAIFAMYFLKPDGNAF